MRINENHRPAAQRPKASYLDAYYTISRRLKSAGMGICDSVCHPDMRTIACPFQSGTADVIAVEPAWRVLAVLENEDSLDMHRAVYLTVVRDQLRESLILFDFADPSLVTGERSTTNGPSQALYLMNSVFVIRQAEDPADRPRSIGGDDDARVAAACLRFLARPPTGPERSRAREFLTKFLSADAATKPGRNRPRAAWRAFSQALYATAEFRYLD